MKLTTYARQQMKHFGIMADGSVNLNYGIRNSVLAATGIDLVKREHSLVGPVYDAGDYQPVVTGKAKIGESTEDAIRREVQEEIGFANISIIPFHHNPLFPEWTFAIAIRGTPNSPPIREQDPRREDYRRRIMVAVLHPVDGEEVNSPPPNDENIIGISLTRLI